MNFSAHGLIAKRLYPILREQYGADFSQKTFHIGNILPDISPRLRAKNHTLEGLGAEVARQIHIAVNPLSSPRAVGLALGIICHCIADFFNEAHCNPRYKRNVKAHLGYESRQYRHMKACALDWSRLPLSPDDMAGYITNQFHQFQGKQIDHQLEWEMTTQICLDVCTGILCCREEVFLPLGAVVAAVGLSD